MPEINTLITDIYSVIGRKDGWFTDDLSKTLSEEIALSLKSQLGEAKAAPRLRLSQMGPRCPKALWYSIHRPELAEPLPAWAEVKFSFGHIIEALAKTLARAAGHEVTGEQDELIVDGVKGHRDCIIDGCIVDVKSCSSIAFSKFKDKSIRNSDTFGYLDQIDAYMVGSLDDDLVRVKDRAYILAIDKQLGHMCLYEHCLREANIRERVERYKRIVSLDKSPECTCGTVADGSSGNFRLDTRAAYSAQKWTCNPQLRCFLYARGPVYLTKVVRKPDVIELDRNGNIVYN